MKSELGQVRLGFRCRVGCHWDGNGRVGSKELKLTGMMCKSEQLHPFKRCERRVTGALKPVFSF
jgi:hypothetical protein